MPKPQLELPTLQNWSCHNCGGCCKQHGIFISESDRVRIESQHWGKSKVFPPGQALFVEETTGGKKWLRLAQPDGACIFLNEDGLCRIHAKFGEHAKPLACRIYPYAFHPAGDHLAVSLRFSCPSVAKNLGKPVAAQHKDLRDLAAAIVPANYRQAPVPRITSRSQLDWADTHRIADTLDKTLAAEGTPVLVKLLRALFWLDLVAKMRFEKVRGERLQELLELLEEASAAEVPEPPEAVAPSRIGLSQFRLLAGQYARKDIPGVIDTSLKGRWAQLQMAMRLASGRGALATLQGNGPDIPIASLDRPIPKIPAESEEMLTRFFRVKIQGRHFFGAPYFNVPLVEGFQSLALLAPVVMWIARWQACSQGREDIQHDDVVEALNITDHQHGYSHACGTWTFRRRVRNLAANGDLPRLLVWFGGAGHESSQPRTRSFVSQ